MLLRALDRELHRFEADHLAVAGVAVDAQQRTGIEPDRRMLVRMQVAFEQHFDIARQHADAVRIVTGEIRRDQVVRDDAGFALVAARRADDRRHYCRQRFGGNQDIWHFRIFRF